MRHMQVLMRSLVVIVVTIAAICFPLLATAQQQITPEAALARVLQQSPVKSDWFDSSFLAQFPPAKIDQVVKQYTDPLGKFQRADASPNGYTVVMERGTFPAKISLDAAGVIISLWFGEPESLTVSSFDDTLKSFAKLPGKVSVAVIEDGKPIATLPSDAALGVGSAFKLAIMAALTDQFAMGKHRLDEVVPLRAEWKSLPSGVLQNWPDGTPLTIATIANEMISISDNTAADALLSIVGRENAEKFAPRNKPFLSTREMFVLKAKSNTALLARFRAANEADRRAMLAEIDRQPFPDASQFGGAPVALDVEWFFTADELCSLIGKVANSPAMRINPGLAKPEQWRQIAFKGGSEGGVLNLTTALTGKNGKHSCVAATWNNDAVLNEGQFFKLYSSLLSALAKQN